ncbi:MAG: PSD1 and planctomycete cytochrome C domain-containing protein [Planctomycetota bacterium]
MRRLTSAALLLAPLACWLAGAGELEAAPAPAGNSPDFAAVRPLLERHCLPCHGGDARESGLSFADRGTFEHGGSRGPVVTAEDPAKSRLLEVLSYKNPDLAMPPSGELEPEVRAVFEAWVRAGAPWPEGEAGTLADPAAHPLEEAGLDPHAPWWAYEALDLQAPPPEVAGATHPIDAFIAQGLAEQGLEAAPAAEPLAAFRRLTFDFTGLPPTTEQWRAFETQCASEGFDRAWQAAIERALASPHFGEHFARKWLDLVRYAETNGYERDYPKQNIWRYRDWIVRAFERDLPYDRFAQWQIAGDELAADLEDPADREEAWLATGYFRLGVWDDEPADRDQALADEIADVVDTTSQVFMATTLGCARCHDHKADPLLQREYYAFTAHFAGLRGYGGGSFRDVLDPPREGVRERAERDADLERIEAEQAELALEWEIQAPDPRGDAPVQVLLADARSEAREWRYLEGEAPEGWQQPGFDDAAWKLGRAGFGAHGTPASRIGTEWRSDRIQLRTTFRLEAIPEALRLLLHYDDDVHVYLNGQEILHRTGYVVNYGAYQLGREALDALVVGRNVIAVDCIQDFGGQYVDVGLDTAIDGQAENGWLEQLERRLAELGNAEVPADSLAARVRHAWQRRGELQRELVREPFRAQVVLERGPHPPEQYVHLRGSVHAPGERVDPGVPVAWSRSSAEAASQHSAGVTSDATQTSGRRRALAEWLFDGGAHLAARVEANRLWQQLFGRGLCRTSGDFGRLGELPTHPELLDYLAAELIRLDWSRKAFLRFLATSEAYRRSSEGPAESLAADPRNDHLWRRDPRRLTAEEFRDATLAVSGELNPERYGPWVYPPLPREVLETSSRPDAAWGRSAPEQAVRRSLYVHTKRSLREPLLAVLDQPDPDLPCPERFPTNVPTQALLTLNGEFTAGRAAAFADELSGEHSEPRAQVAAALERALGRAAAEDEVARNLAFLERLTGELEVPEREALELFLLGLFNRNEFLWLD